VIAGILAFAATACRVLDADHCANAGGDATCRERSEELGYCDRCVGANDGCVATPPADPNCGDAESSTSTTDAVTTIPPTSSQADDAESSPDVDTSIGEVTTTSSGSESGTSASTTTAASTSSTTESTGGPECGDGIVEGDEACDGARLGGLDCAGMPEYGGGTLACADDCALDTSGCTACLGATSPCDADEECCSENCSGLGVCL
jgi:hypothetical protein